MVAPEAVAEQAGQFAGSLLSRARRYWYWWCNRCPGAVVGGISGPALFEAVQLSDQLLNNAQEIMTERYLIKRIG